MTTNKINLRIVDDVIFNEVFTFNMGVEAELSENNKKLTIKPIGELTDVFADDGAKAVKKCVEKKLLDKNIGTRSSDVSLEITVPLRKFKFMSLRNGFALSVVDTKVLAVMKEDKD